MNKVMIAGLALGKDPNLDVCQVCNFDLSWLIQNPSTLLWVDKIILTPEILDGIKGWQKREGDEGDQGKAIGLIFEQLDSLGLIETNKVSDVISKPYRDKLYEQIEQESQALIRTFPDSIKEDDGSFFVENIEYCMPFLWTMYASMELASKWNANLILPDKSYHYLRYKFGLLSAQLQVQKEKIKAFDKIFTSKVPEVDLFPSILFASGRCGTCEKEQKCRITATSTIEKNMKSLMKWREYDELHQLRETLDRISKEVAKNEQASADDFIKAFESEEQKVRKRIKSVFPKVERWANLVALLSAPVGVWGISTGSVPVATIGAAGVGMASVTKKGIDILKSKYRWVGFRDKT